MFKMQTEKHFGGSTHPWKSPRTPESSSEILFGSQSYEISDLKMIIDDIFDTYRSIIFLVHAFSSFSMRV